MAESVREENGSFRGIETVIRAVGGTACCILLPAQIALAVFYVAARQLYTFQLTPLQELEWHFFFALVFLCIGMTHLADRNVRIDVVRGRFGQRTRCVIEIVGFFLALLPFSLALIYFGTENAVAAFISNERSRASLGLPERWIIKSLIPLGGLLLLMAGSVVTVRNVHRMTRAHLNASDKIGPPKV